MESILFFIKRLKLLKDGSAPIYIRITANGTMSEFSSGQSIMPPQWVVAKGRSKSNTLVNKQLNTTLDQQEHQLRQIVINLNQLGKQVSANEIIKIFKGKDETNITLLELYNQHNIEMAALVDKTVAKATYKRHCTSIKLFKEFLVAELNIDDIKAKEVTSGILEQYRHYMMTKRNNNNNTTIKYLKNIGKILHIALIKGVISRSPLELLTLKLDKVEKDFLSASELNRLQNHNFAVDRLAQVRDVFVFCCYTGLAYNDVYSLTSADIVEDDNGKLWVHKKRGKTGIMCDIPLLIPAMTLLNKYWTKNEGRIFTVLSNQKMNAYLKEIAVICGITKELSTHTARHTFATTVTLANKVAIENVSKMLGHASIKMTQQYAKILNESIAADMIKLDQTLQSKTV